MSENDLLSHGEAPHYHRRCIISLLSSGWDQVVLMLYVSQTKSCLRAIGSEIKTALSELKGNLVPGDDLLSHGEAPHYHRR